MWWAWVQPAGGTTFDAALIPHNQGLSEFRAEQAIVLADGDGDVVAVDDDVGDGGITREQAGSGPGDGSGEGEDAAAVGVGGHGEQDGLFGGTTE